MIGLLDRIRGGETLVCDGALGTMLLDRGLAAGECPESVNLARPDLLEEIARLYVDAGADLVTTNTFGGSPLKLALYRLDGAMEEINRAGVAAVRGAVGSRAYVLGDLGPTGRLLKPYGDVEPEAAAESYRRQVRVLIDAGVDAVAVETMTDLAEAAIAVRAARSISPDVPILATMTFDRTPRGFFTIMGVTIERAAAGLAEAGADVIGSNCGNGIDAMIEVAREFRRRSTMPLLIQSNAGLPEIVEGRALYRETPEFFSARASELIDLGVSVIGGCCGTTPEHIRALRRVVDAARRQGDSSRNSP